MLGIAVAQLSPGQHPQTLTALLPCRDWLDSANGLQRTLFPATDGGLKLYKVWVHTSSCPGAGTDGVVSMELHGASGSSKQQVLDAPPGAFARGKVCYFQKRVDFELFQQSGSSKPSGLDSPPLGRWSGQAAIPLVGLRVLRGEFEDNHRQPGYKHR